jgi:peptidoglycan/LPS O-acetylase OafA/YrhL
MATEAISALQFREASSRRTALPALTGVRFFAAFYVVLSHSLPWLAMRFRIPWPAKIFLSNGYLAVAMFFLLSGFILAYTYDGQIAGSRNRARFWEARFARIYPVYLLSLVLAYWFERGLHVKTQIAVLTMTQAWNPLSPETVGAWNYPAWTLSVEAFFYLVFPSLLPFLSRRSTVALRCMGIACLVVAVLGHTPLEGLQNRESFASLGSLIPLPVWRLPEFLLGVVLGLYFLRTDAFSQKPSRPATVALAVAGILLALSLPLGKWVSLVIIPFAVLIYELACANNWLAMILSTRWMVLLGGASYAIYLLQFPVRAWTRTLFQHFSASVQSLSAPLTPLILIVFSIAVFRFWEEPARRALRTWLDRFSRGNPASGSHARQDE